MAWEVNAKLLAQWAWPNSISRFEYLAIVHNRSPAAIQNPTSDWLRTSVDCLTLRSVLCKKMLRFLLWFYGQYVQCNWKTHHSQLLAVCLCLSLLFTKWSLARRKLDRQLFIFFSNLCFMRFYSVFPPKGEKKTSWFYISSVMCPFDNSNRNKKLRSLQRRKKQRKI